MMSVEDEKLESVRREIIDKHEDSLASRELGVAIMALALTIGFFGSSAALMPSQQTATGMFSGDLEVRSPVVENMEFRNKNIHDTGFSLVLDAEVRNPNVVEAELENIVYQVKADGDTIKADVKPGSSNLEAGESEMVATEYSVDFAGISNVEEVIRKFEEGEREVTIDGTFRFDVAGETVELPFEKITSME